MKNSHLTAKTRKDLSAPLKFLLKNNLIIGKVLDYGCGKGFDADYLKADKYDPYFFPNEIKGSYNTILCNYVLNVVSLEEELRIIKEIRARLNSGGKAYISVRRDKFVDGYNARGTYQRWSEPDLVSLKKSANFEIYVIEN